MLWLVLVVMAVILVVDCVVFTEIKHERREAVTRRRQGRGCLVGVREWGSLGRETW